MHILDDFLFIAPTKDQCKRDLDNFVLFCNHLGVPLAPDKTVGPDTALQFADITLDSVQMEARHPEEELQFRVQGSLLSWLTDYLTDRTQFSVVNGHHSSVLNVTCGIPQGSVLGPTLFALYTNDLPRAVTSGSIFGVL